MQAMEDTITYQMELQQPLAVCFLIVPLAERILVVKVIGDGVRGYYLIITRNWMVLDLDIIHDY